LENLQKKYPQQLGVKIAFDNALAHKIEAGADMFLMPSRYEPCGLNQIYSLKYGTVPIVRATGGLDDTIQDFSPLSAEGNGFKFRDYAASGLLETIQRALRAYRDRPLWEKLMVRGMSADFSWKRSASEYLKVYQETIEKKKAKTAAR
jgi:starch synthase